ncbi:MAG: CpsD/CapB family tyrosine-protein kinase [Anaerolineales bacterium]
MTAETLITLTQPDSPAAEAYRALHLNLTYASLDHPLETLVITAPAPERGGLRHGEVAANLAVALARADRQVVLVDSDLRRPHLHEIFDVPNEGGLTEAILRIGDSGGEIPLIATEIPNLKLLTSGRLLPNPSDVLGSPQMAALLGALKERSDLVILTAPPVTAAVDATVLATQVDGLLLVVRSGGTRRDRLEEAKEILARVDANLLGAVLIDAPRGLFTGY